MSHDITKGDFTLSLADDRGRKKQLTISRDGKVLTAVRYDPLNMQEQLDVLVKLEAYDKERDWMTDLNELAARVGQNGTGQAFGPVVVTLADVEREDVEWLWYGRLALGKPTGLSGDPGVGKSFVSAAIGTAISLGRALPGEKGVREATGVLYLNCEDGVKDTMRPRFEDMGADLTKIHILTAVRGLSGQERHPSIVDDLPDIEDALVKRDCKLLVIDPINNYLGSQLDTNRDAALRGALAPLSALCERLRVACIFVTHLTKSSRDRGIYRPQGSIAYVGLSRVTLLAGANAENPHDRAVIWLKGNNSEPMPAIGYEIMAGGKWRWIPGESALTKEQCFAPEAGSADTSKLEDAETFLTEALTDGPKPSKELMDEAKTELGISQRTMHSAKARLGVIAVRVGYGEGGKWQWHLGSKVASSAPYGNLATFDESVSESGDEGAGVCNLCAASISILNESGLCGRCAATSPDGSAQEKLLELAKSQGWPQFVQYQHPSGRLEGLHMGRPDHWREWVEKAEPAVLTAVTEALEPK